MPRQTARMTAHRQGTCFLPSGLSPSVLEFHQISRSSCMAGLRVADYHRRLGITPTPEHIAVWEPNGATGMRQAQWLHCGRKRAGAPVSGRGRLPLGIGQRPVSGYGRLGLR